MTKLIMPEGRQIRPFVWGGVAFIASLSLFLLLPRATPPTLDLIQYWAAAKAVVVEQNPYDERVIGALEADAGRYDEVIRMWNPPLIIPIILPFAAFRFSELSVFWSSLSIAAFIAIVISLIETNRASSAPRMQRFALSSLLILFTPLFESLALGQISIVLLIAVAVWWTGRENRGARAILPGAALALTLIKPHLLVPLYISQLFCAYKRRERGFAVGFVGMAIFLGALAWFMQPNIFNWYASAMGQPPIYWRTPNLGSFLQGLTGIHTVFIRFLPLTIVCVAFIGFLFLKGLSAGRICDSRAHAFIIPLSLLVSPYGWIFDQLILLPVLFHLVLKESVDLTAVRQKATFFLLALGQLGIVFLPSAWGQERGITILTAYTIVSGYHFFRQFNQQRA